jgi:hypothetical protein
VPGVIGDVADHSCFPEPDMAFPVSGVIQPLAAGVNSERGLGTRSYM